LDDEVTERAEALEADIAVLGGYEEGTHEYAQRLEAASELQELRETIEKHKETMARMGFVYAQYRPHAWYPHLYSRLSWTTSHEIIDLPHDSRVPSSHDIMDPLTWYHRPPLLI